MKVNYFPGCTLRTKAKDLDFYARECAKILGIELVELPDWQCCGGVFVTSSDEIASKLSCARALVASRDDNRALVSVCSACHNVIKQTNHAIKNDAKFADAVNRYLAQDEEHSDPYFGETEVLHYLELLRDKVGFDKIREAVKNPLTGKKIAAYYGCLLLRPGKVMAFDDVENPQIMEDFIRALGAEPVIYPARNECCGGYIALEDAASAKKKSDTVSHSAANHGADMIVTACPLCKYNLTKNESPLPVVYFTELLALALGVKENDDAE
ncbi:MAG: CoB--CoM heterodisulfide reductase iron-sulfur subunit B family protein [Oscillospiraceae bacterium]|nr:CoB--CoM heterodisulfide reductase iron-sulfur subunit B family protein [Oscillospiraceae bacterium]